MIDFVGGLVGKSFSSDLMAVIHGHMIKEFLAQGKGFDLSQMKASADSLVIKLRLSLISSPLIIIF